MHNMRKEFARTWRAFFSLFSPRRIPMVMEPPIPTRVPKEVSSVTTGPQTPAPASASAPSPEICPMYIRSIML